MERLFELLDVTIEKFIELLETKAMDLSPLQILVIAGFIIGLYYFIKYAVKSFFKHGKKGFGYVKKPFIIWHKKAKLRRQNKKVCHVCKNPLRYCNCQHNRGLSYKQRVKNWRKREAELRILRKKRRLEEKLRNKPVETINHRHKHRR